MRTRITAISDRRVRMEYQNDAGESLVEEYRAPRDGGYVRNERGIQVCQRLALLGATLWWSPDTDGPLVALIRREYRRWQAKERREAQHARHVIDWL